MKTVPAQCAASASPWVSVCPGGTELPLDILRALKRYDCLRVLAAGVAHDANNLLMPLGGNLELILLDLDQPQAITESAQEAQGSARDLKILFRQLHDFTMAPEPTEEEAPFDLNELLRRSAAIYRGALGRQNRLLLELTSDSLVVGGAPVHVQEVMIHLLQNAGAAMQAAPGRCWVRSRLARCPEDAGPAAAAAALPPGAYAEVSVSDQGPGVRPEMAARIFEPRCTTLPGACGMGLTLALEAVTRMGGAVWLDAPANTAGATFRFWLPRAQC
ncbi:MAG: hypothetical protein K9N49_05255 [Candidatus Marinimicrobia bacterium]|nr:hypothetical protein [Candidatus Neomarinimicrobiota bacterium]